MTLPLPAHAARWRAATVLRDAAHLAGVAFAAALACAAGIIATAPLLAAAFDWISMVVVGVAGAVASTTTAAVAARARLAVTATLGVFACGALAAGMLLTRMQDNPWSAVVVLAPTLLAGAVAVAVVGVRRLGVVRGLLVATTTAGALFALTATHAFRWPWYGRIARAHDGTGDPVPMRWVVLPGGAATAGATASEESYFLVAPAHRARIAARVASGAPPHVEINVGSGASGRRLQPVTDTPELRARITAAVAAAERAQLAWSATEGHMPRALVGAPLPPPSLAGWAIYR